MLDKEKICRFSLCNCATIYMEKYYNRDIIGRTYTPQFMSLDLFIKKAAIRKKIYYPYSSFWPKISGANPYIIPSKIRTFLFSPFNEIFHDFYTFGDNIRYAIPKDKRFDRIRPMGKRTIKINPTQFRDKLKSTLEKVDCLWRRPLKILVFYDYNGSTKKIKNRAIKFQNICTQFFKEDNTIQIIETKVFKDRIFDSWNHYSKYTYSNLLDRVKEIEVKNEKSINNNSNSSCI